MDTLDDPVIYHTLMREAIDPILGFLLKEFDVQTSYMRGRLEREWRAALERSYMDGVTHGVVQGVQKESANAQARYAEGLDDNG